MKATKHPFPKICSFTTALLIPLVGFVGCSTAGRPPLPPEGQPVVDAWGSVPHLQAEGDVSYEYTQSLVESLSQRFEQQKHQHPGQPIPYRALTLSGGGSRGAWGAGVLYGWTKRGDRPEFDVVTGISTGALMATHAFLGSAFDEELTLYKEITNEEVFKKRGFIKMLQSDSALDTRPLRTTLESVITEDTLDHVAMEHDRGRRLFIGTTNLDANRFTVWDMGAIAKSQRPDRYKRYIDVVLASASFPVAFPPVYIEVEGPDGTFTHMHTDGGVRETVFFFDFLEAIKEAINLADLDISDFKQELYLLNNGKLAQTGTYRPVKGNLAAVAAASVSSMMTKVTLGSLYRLWIISMVDGADFHISYVPSHVELESSSLTFEPEEMAELFDYGYRLSLEGKAWGTQLAPETEEELLRLIASPTSSFNRRELPEWLLIGNE